MILISVIFECFTNINFLRESLSYKNDIFHILDQKGKDGEIKGQTNLLT